MRPVPVWDSTRLWGGGVGSRLTLLSHPPIPPSPQVVLENQRLGMGAREFLDDSKRLAEEGVLPGCRLWVVDTGEHSNRDIAGEAGMPPVTWTVDCGLE